MRKAKLVYVLATDGYLGESGSIEMAYALAINVPVILSQPVTQFGEEVPETIKNIIENNKDLLPIVPIPGIRSLKDEKINTIIQNKEKPGLKILSDGDRKRIFFSILSLMRRLKAP